MPFSFANIPDQASWASGSSRAPSSTESTVSLLEITDPSPQPTIQTTSSEAISLIPSPPQSRNLIPSSIRQTSYISTISTSTGRTRSHAPSVTSSLPTYSQVRLHLTHPLPISVPTVPFRPSLRFPFFSRTPSGHSRSRSISPTPSTTSLPAYNQIGPPPPAYYDPAHGTLPDFSQPPYAPAPALTFAPMEQMREPGVVPRPVPGWTRESFGEEQTAQEHFDQHVPPNSWLRAFPGVFGMPPIGTPQRQLITASLAFSPQPQIYLPQTQDQTQLLAQTQIIPISITRPEYQPFLAQLGISSIPHHPFVLHPIQTQRQFAHSNPTHAQVHPFYTLPQGYGQGQPRIPRHGLIR
jgi:hypothetical protein